MGSSVKEKFQISPFFVFFLINANQVGVGILNFQTNLVRSMNNDGWIAILISGISVNLMIFLIYFMFRKAPSNEFGDITQYVFGKWIGQLFNILYIFYFSFLSLTVLVHYMDVIHVWLFKEIPGLLFASVLLLLVYYIHTGGFRTIAGWAYFSIVLTYWMTFICFYVMKYSHIRFMFPMFDHSFSQIMAGVKDASLSMFGFETLLVYYPFIKNAKTSQKFAHLGALLTTSLNLLVFLVSIAYYSSAQLELTKWPTLTLTSIVKLPFIQRFEFIEVSLWLLLVIPNIAIPLWAASRMAKQVFHTSQRITLIVLSVLILVMFSFFVGATSFESFNKWVEYSGYMLVYGLIVCMIIGLMLKKRWVKKRA
ncbi:GerAB/ArcD/ProY family transporter [Bacillus sp. A015]|uniref:GerAB/ArcD/ProY family transporter n=1 Tax=Bacillus TaxID=1386 RepID=UPI001E517290|nr:MULTISPECIES: GerAB/ArcD/ProY family transporter [Bacillus]MCC9087392.1 spore germination protein [Bacillus pumilus]MED1749139.1 GerAB/ArcD/ProY family transporter [Bacillus zhangzhouensis]